MKKLPSYLWVELKRHLSRDEVKKLAGELEYWLKNGKLQGRDLCRRRDFK